MDEKFIHPYIPNSVPNIKQEMLCEIGAHNAEELYSQMIPERLRLKRRMELPEPLTAELDLKRHVEAILSKNITCNDYISFLGSGCWQHFIPEVCNVIAQRSEFLTAYSGGVYSDLGRFQASFEFQSLICELVDMEVSGIPTYDWGSSAGNAVRMAARITNRKEVIVPKNLSPARLSILKNFCNPIEMDGRLEVKEVEYDPETGATDLRDLERKVNSETACVYFENPNYLGMIEDHASEVSRIAHSCGAESVVGVDPISLGVIAPPSAYGADIVCGEIQPLGIHMSAGGGLSGFIASRDEEKYVSEYPLRLISIARAKDGSYGFGECRFERTSYWSRENAKDWVGTTTALWSILAAVYLSLMGPQGMKEVGEAIIQRSRYAMKLLTEIDGIRIPYKGFFKEYPVNFLGKKVEEINKGLLKHRIFGGKDISGEYPEIGQSAVYCFTEIHTEGDLEKLASALREASK